MSHKLIFWCSCHEYDRSNREVMIDTDLTVTIPDPHYVPISKYDYSTNPPTYVTDYVHSFDNDKKGILDIDPDSNGFYNMTIIHDWIDGILGV